MVIQNDPFNLNTEIRARWTWLTLKKSVNRNGVWFLWVQHEGSCLIHVRMHSWWRWSRWETVFCSQAFVLSRSVIVLFVAAAVSVEINSRHYFWSNLQITVMICNMTKLSSFFAFLKVVCCACPVELGFYNVLITFLTFLRKQLYRESYLRNERNVSSQLLPMK